jgi:hypothetical protein
MAAGSPPMHYRTPMPIYNSTPWLLELPSLTLYRTHNLYIHLYLDITSPTERLRFLSQFYGRGFPATRYRTLIPHVASIHLPSKTWVIHVYARGFPDDGVADFMSIYISTSRVRPTVVHFHSSRILWPRVPVWAPSNSHAPCARYTSCTRNFGDLQFDPDSKLATHFSQHLLIFQSIC